MTPSLHVCIGRLDEKTATLLATRLREFAFSNIFDIPGVDAVTESGTPFQSSDVIWNRTVTLEVKGHAEVAYALDALARFMNDVPSRNGVPAPFVNEDDLMTPFIGDDDLMALVNAVVEPKRPKKRTRRAVADKLIRLFGYSVLAVATFYAATGALYVVAHLIK